MAEGEGFEPPKACTLVVFKFSAPPLNTKTGPDGHFRSGEFPHWVDAAYRAVQRPLGLLASTNVQASTRAKKAPLKVEWAENRLAFRRRWIHSGAWAAHSGPDDSAFGGEGVELDAIP